jgi:DNA-binding transcriptional LysR family regulator
MKTPHIRRLDLNLLWVFYAVMKHRKLTHAADKLSMTQSALSHALARLRHTFGDELFLRTGHGLKPTAHALELAPFVEEIIERAIATMVCKERFDPAVEAEFRLGAPDHCTIPLAPVLADIRAQAPRLRLTLRHICGSDAVEALMRDEIDIALCVIPDPHPPEIELKSLFDEAYVVIAREGHAAFANGLDIDAYAAADHAVVELGADTERLIDRALARQGRQRRIVMTLSPFSVVMQAVASSDMIATISRTPAIAHASHYGFTIFELPMALPKRPVSAAWHRRQSKCAIRRLFLENIERRLGDCDAMPAAARAHGLPVLVSNSEGRGGLAFHSIP